MKIKILIFFSFLLGSNLVGQEIVDKSIADNDLSSIKPTNARAFICVYAPPTSGDGLGFDFAVHSTLQMGEMAQARGGANFGTFMGIKGGYTQFLSSNTKTKNQKFVISRTSNGKNSETVKYFKLPAEVNNKFGVAADFQLGRFRSSGFFYSFEAGLEWQLNRKAKANYGERIISASSNGWISFKLQAFMMNVNYSDVVSNQGRQAALGGQLVTSVITSPWKKFTLFASLPFGYGRYLSIDEEVILFSINIGASYNIK